MASGGSTGRPKLIEAGGDSRVPAAIGYPLGAQEGDVNLLSVPLSHNTGFTTFADRACCMGHHLVLMPRFDPHEFLRLVTEHRVTFLATVPTIMQRLLPVYRADPDAYDLSSIRRFWHLAAPCPPAIKQAWIELLGPEVVWELYGGTELQALTFISGDQWLTHPGFGRRGRRRRDEGARRRRQRVPARRGRRDLHAPGPGQRARPTATSAAPPRRRDGWDSLGDLGYFDDGRLPLPHRPPGRHVHRRRPQRVPGRDRVGAGRASGGAVLPGRRRARTTIWARCRTRWCRHRRGARRGGGDRVPAPTGSPAYKVPRTVEFVDRPLRDDAGKARRSAVRDEVIARRQARARR